MRLLCLGHFQTSLFRSVVYNGRSMEQVKPKWGAFWSLVVIQSINSLNEKGVQFLLIALGIWLGTALQYPLSVLIVLPFVVFSPLGGWVADRYCRTRLLQVMVLLQVVALAGMTVGLFMENVGVAVIFFTVFCVQAMFFSPAKKGLVKDMVGSRYIGFASGILEISSMLALLLGQILALGIVYYLLRRWGDDSGWVAAGWPCVVCALAAVGVFVLSLALPKFPAVGRRPFSWSICWEHFSQLRLLWNDRVLRFSEVGIGYFWFIAGEMMLIALQMAQDAQGSPGDTGVHFMQVLGQQRDSAALIAWISGGSVLGGALASCLCARSIRTSLATVGGTGMCVSCLALVWLPYGHPLFYAALATAGCAAAGYLVPLNALLQDHADDDKRGDVIAAGNLVDCALGMLAVVVQLGMRALGLSGQAQCGVLAVCSAVVTLYLLRELCRYKQA